MSSQVQSKHKGCLTSQHWQDSGSIQKGVSRGYASDHLSLKYCISNSCIRQDDSRLVLGIIEFEGFH